MQRRREAWSYHTRCVRHIHTFCFSLLTPSSSSLLPPVGVHLEGPFINPQKRGAHSEPLIITHISPSALQNCYHSLDNVRIVTLAPELPGALDAIQWLHMKRRVVVAIGHSMATLDIAEECGSRSNPYHSPLQCYATGGWGHPSSLLPSSLLLLPLSLLPPLLPPPPPLLPPPPPSSLLLLPLPFCLLP